jgi:hypothetical protein
MSTSARLERVLSKFQVKRQRGDNYDVLCPVHGDTRSSAGVKMAPSGAILIHCMAGCATEDIIAAAGIDWKDLFDEDNDSFERESRLPVATYVYTDPDGIPLFRVLKYRDQYGKKSFSQQAADGKGGWLPSLGAINKVPYNMVDVAKAAKEERRVIIVEGEKDVETLRKHGFVASTTPGGAGGWNTKYAEFFRGAEVIVIPDNDAPGKKYAKAICTDLRNAKILELPGLGEKEDVSDWLIKHPVDELRMLLGPESVDMNPCSWGEFQSERDKIRYLCGDILAAQTVNIMVADAGLGKTTLLAQMCLSLASGRPFLGIKTHAPIPVLLLEAEGARPIFRERAELCRKAMGIDHSELRNWFIQSKDLDDFRLSHVTLERQIKMSGAKFVVLDTLGYFLLPGDENSSKDWKEYVMEPIRYLKKKYDCAFMLVHHEGKPAEGKSGHHRGRGTSAMFGDCDTWMSLEKRNFSDDDLMLLREQEGEERYDKIIQERRLIWRKSKVGRFPRPIIMDFDFENACFYPKESAEKVNLIQQPKRYQPSTTPQFRKADPNDPFGG